ncbi:hypothetical protein JXA32_11805 [Candidatus Sumerlaeota bacterium]|nr:hypothetical protein [Candidatus Sumerlaeota bacterium]
MGREEQQGRYGDIGGLGDKKIEGTLKKKICTQSHIEHKGHIIDFALVLCVFVPF